MNVKMYAPPGTASTYLQDGTLKVAAADGSITVDSAFIPELLRGGWTQTAPRPVSFIDDFLGAAYTIPTVATVGTPWGKKIVGAAPPTVGIQANSAGGQVRCALTSTSEKQDADLYFLDQLNLDSTQALVFEARCQMPVTPTGTAIAVIGLASAWADGPLTITNSAFFTFTGSLTGACRASDNGVAVNQNSACAFIGTSDWHIFKIDYATTPGRVLFFFDDVQVASGAAFTWTRTGAAALLQPYVGVYKASGTDVGTLGVDYIKASYAGR